MGTCLSLPSIDRSLTRAALTAAPKVAMYNKSSAFSEGLDIIARFSMYAFKASKAFACSSPYCMLPVPFNALKNGRHFFTNLEMNLFSEASLPIKFWTSFFVVDGFIRLIASIFLGFASMPLLVIMQPNSLPLRTPKIHFSGFSFSPCRGRFANVSRRSCM